MRLVYCVVLLASMLVVGCGDNAKKEGAESKVPAATEAGKVAVVPEAESRATILLYTRLVAEGYSGMDMSGLQEAATANRVAKVTSHMEALKAQGIKLLAQPEIVQPTTVREIGEDRLDVLSDEKWKNSFVGSDDKEIASDDSIYRLQYTLVSSGGRWLVDEITIGKQRIENVTGADDLVRRADDSPAEEVVEKAEGAEKK